MSRRRQGFRLLGVPIFKDGDVLLDAATAHADACEAEQLCPYSEASQGNVDESFNFV